MLNNYEKIRVKKFSFRHHLNKTHGIRKYSNTFMLFMVNINDISMNHSFTLELKVDTTTS